MYICKHCGKEFIPKYKVLKHHNPLYCSAHCYHEATRTGAFKKCKQCGKEFYIYGGRIKREFCSTKCRKISKRVTKICPTCKKPFTVYKSMGQRYIYCSNACKTKFTLYKHCLRCGKLFTAKREDIKYCSEECRRPSVYINCLNCGNKFRVVPSQKEIRKFCSFSCYRKYRGESSIEIIIRKSLDRLNIKYIQEFQINSYSVDFFLPNSNICLEVDGKYWHKNVKKDTLRDKKLKVLGYDILRIKELDIINTDNIDNLVIVNLNIHTSSI